MAVVVLLLGGGPAPVRAESLLELFDADPLATLGAPEGLSATRRGALLYPAPGLPAVIHPGDEVVARVRVRRALTPPPGVQQARVLRPWRARLLGRPAAAATGAPPSPELPLTVVQIRPENEGFAYRVRLRSLPWTMPGLYDLEIWGPGFRDVQARAVRVVADDDSGLVLATVTSGDALAREAEALWLLDPTAVLVPGGLLDARRALARWPVATFAVPSSEESTARRCLEIEPALAAAASEAASCPAREPEGAGCLVDALGGPAGLDPCGDALVTYTRRAGPAVYAVGLGGVTLLGAQTRDGPPSSRASVSIRLLGGGGASGRLVLPPPPSTGPARDQAEWLAMQAGRGEDLVVLAADSPEDWIGSHGAATAAAFRSAGDRRIFVSGPGPHDGSAAAGPRTIRLERAAAEPRRGPEQIWGLSPEEYRLGEVAPRRSSAPPVVVISELSEGTGLSVRIFEPPRHRLRIRVVMPGGDRGWHIVAEGRPARIVEAAPAHGDPCTIGPVLLLVEVEPGSGDPTSFQLLPGASASPVAVVGPERSSLVVGSPVRLEARGDHGGAERRGAPLVAWALGDGAFAVGAGVEHRYRESGRVRVCALAVEPGGGVAEPVALDLEVLGQGAAARRSVDGLSPAIAGAVGAALFVALLMLLARGNIFGTRRR